MLGDLRILAVADAASRGRSAAMELLLDTERVALQELFDMIRRFKVGYDVELHKRTLERGLLSLIGPEPRARSRAPRSWPRADEHANAPSSSTASPALAVRTDVGVDLLCERQRHRAADRGAARARGAQPVSEQAAECLRVERGRPRFGIDIDETTIPQEAGLNERAVSFTKGCYVGQETVARLHYKGKPNRHLRGLRLSAPASTGDRAAPRRARRRAASAASRLAAHGPIALALVRREAEPGATVASARLGATAESSSCRSPSTDATFERLSAARRAPGDARVLRTARRGDLPVIASIHAPASVL